MEEASSKENKNLNDIFQFNIEQLKVMTNFLNTFANNFKNISFFNNNKIKSKIVDKEFLNKSFLSNGIEAIYDSFKICINNIKRDISNIQNDLIKPMELFIDQQSKIYQNNNIAIKDLFKKGNEHKMMLDHSKNNYYKASYEVKKNSNNYLLSQNTFKNDKLEQILSLEIKNKMIAKNLESIYKYKLNEYNLFASNINKNYQELKMNLDEFEKKRILFIKETLDKFKLSIEEINNEYINFVSDIQKNFSSKDCQNEQKLWEKKLSSKEDILLPLETFVPFREFYRKNEELLINNKYNFDIKIDSIDKYKKISMLKEEEILNIFNDIIDKLLKKDILNPEDIKRLFDIIQNHKRKESWKLFVDSLLNKNNQLSILKFSNLKNLEYLSDFLNYIILREDSIFEGNFELNIKIIFISAKIFYQNEENNDKIYLSAVLSKNKYLRTSEFWRNIIEFKLANKINESIKRFNDVFTFKKGEKRKSFFSKIGGAMGLTNPFDDSILSKNRIIPLIKNFNALDKKKIEVIDKISIQELLNLIKDNIPDMMNFNYQPEICLDLIAKLIDEYKIPKKNIKFFVVYTNVCRNTIRRLIKNEEADKINRISNLKNNDGKIKIFKLLARTIPFLDYKDFNNLLLCSKTANKKLKNKIYSHVLKQKNINNKIRLMIWENKLKVRELKAKYNYREILNKANDEKVKKLIVLDVSRTSVKEPEKEEEIKNKLIDVLFAISQFSENINYFQGMQYIVLFLMELYGEEESFYLFLALLLNTEYSLIFEKDLQKLKIFFYVFKRIILLFEPELSSFLNINNMQADLFLPPWFITLFSGTHHFLRKIEDNTNIVVRIIDYFILYGWKSSMSIGCALLHAYEKVIMKKDFEHLNKFLLNDILKQDFFLNKNLSLVEKSLEEFKISKKLISNIEAEYSEIVKTKENNKEGL